RGRNVAPPRRAAVRCGSGGVFCTFDHDGRGRYRDVALFQRGETDPRPPLTAAHKAIRHGGSGRSREGVEAEAAGVRPTVPGGSVRYTCCDTAIGTVWAAWSYRGIVCLGLDDEREDDFARRDER